MRTFLRSKVTLLFLTLGLLLAFSGVALADIVYVSNSVAVDANKTPVNDNATKNPGDTGTAYVWVEASKDFPDGDPAGCNAGGTNNPVTVTLKSDNPNVTFPNGNSAQITDCPNNSYSNLDTVSKGIGYQVASSASAGTATISAEASGGKDPIKDQYDATDTLKITINSVTPADTTAPVISYQLNPPSPDGSNGWYKSNVSLTWSVTDPESATSIVKTGCNDQNIVADQQETTYSCSASSDGGSAGPVDVKIKRDATPPVVSLVGGPADGGSYDFGSVPSTPTCQASDATSGLNGTCSVSGYSTDVGSHTVKAEAKDLAGNTNSASNTYTVNPYTLSGFYAPVDYNGTWNTVKGGSTVPLKFEVFNSLGELTNTSVVRGFTAKGVTCPGANAPSDDIEMLSTGGTSLRYDGTAGQFIQNWQTPKKPGTCYDVTMTTIDGTSLPVAHFQLK